MKKMCHYLISRIESLYSPANCWSDCSKIPLSLQQNGTEHYLKAAFSHFEYPKNFYFEKTSTCVDYTSEHRAGNCAL